MVISVHHILIVDPSCLVAGMKKQHPHLEMRELHITEMEVKPETECIINRLTENNFKRTHIENYLCRVVQFLYNIVVECFNNC